MRFIAVVGATGRNAIRFSECIGAGAVVVAAGAGRVWCFADDVAAALLLVPDAIIAICFEHGVDADVFAGAAGAIDLAVAAAAVGVWSLPVAPEELADLLGHVAAGAIGQAAGAEGYFRGDAVGKVFDAVLPFGPHATLILAGFEHDAVDAGFAVDAAGTEWDIAISKVVYSADAVGMPFSGDACILFDLIAKRLGDIIDAERVIQTAGAGWQGAEDFGITGAVLVFVPLGIVTAIVVAVILFLIGYAVTSTGAAGTGGRDVAGVAIAVGAIAEVGTRAVDLVHVDGAGVAGAAGACVSTGVDSAVDVFALPVAAEVCALGFGAIIDTVLTQAAGAGGGDVAGVAIAGGVVTEVGAGAVDLVFDGAGITGAAGACWCAGVLVTDDIFALPDTADLRALGFSTAIDAFGADAAGTGGGDVAGVAIAGGAITEIGAGAVDFVFNGAVGTGTAGACVGTGVVITDDVFALPVTAEVCALGFGAIIDTVVTQAAGARGIRLRAVGFLAGEVLVPVAAAGVALGLGGILDAGTIRQAAGTAE